MAHSNTTFSQLLSFIPRQKFQAFVDKRQGDKRCRTLFCWDQFVAMLYSQVHGCRSLRDLTEQLDVQKNRLYHLGISPIKRSSLADANESRPIGIYYDLFFDLLKKVTDTALKNSLLEGIQLIDSTTISLNKQQFEWAKFRTGKAGIKIHTVFDPDADAPTFFQITHAKVSDSKPVAKWGFQQGFTYVFDRAYNSGEILENIIDADAIFVGRMKKCMKYDEIESLPVLHKNVISDELIEVKYKTSERLKGKTLRRITYLRSEDQKELVFITNDLERSAEDVADLYKRRWQIELFFKWIKQNLKIKTFLGQSENAVMIQIIVAMISYLLLRLIQQNVAPKMSLQTISRRIKSALMQRRKLMEVLCEKEPIPPNIRQMDLGLI